MPKTITSVQCTRGGHEISLASSTRTYVVKLHKCGHRGKRWFPRKPGTPRVCPTCKTTLHALDKSCKPPQTQQAVLRFQGPSLGRQKRFSIKEIPCICRSK